MVAAREPSAPVVEAHGLSKRFGGREAVRAIDLTVLPARCFGVLGPNGAGKTTTLRMIMGVSPRTAGELRVFGLPVDQAGDRIRARMGVVPQADNLDPDFTVEENLRMYGAYFGIVRRELDARIPDLLAFVELTERRHARIDALSGGMRRRLTLARSLINEPDLIVLDEPTTGLDPQVRHMIWARLRALVARGKTLLLTSHYMEEAERLCDELVIMDQGRILDRGSPVELIRRHSAQEVVEIRGAEATLGALPAALAATRIERVGDTTFCYTPDARALIDQLERRPGLTYLHRPASLEDVFLKLTGRELRE